MVTPNDQMFAGVGSLKSEQNANEAVDKATGLYSNARVEKAMGTGFPARTKSTVNPFGSVR